MVQVNLSDAFEKFRVQPYIVGVLCQDRLQLLCQRIHLVVRLCTEQVEEHR